MAPDGAQGASDGARVHAKERAIRSLNLAALLAAFTLYALPAEARFISTSPQAQVSKRTMPKNWRTWVKIGRCEQPGRGAWGIRWSHPGPTYGGGLGIYQGTWQHFKPRGYPATPGRASWRQQMIVAERIRRAVGITAWGCHYVV